MGSAHRIATTSPTYAGSGVVSVPEALEDKAPRVSAQSFPTSGGRGSLEAARGNVHVAFGSDVLSGERDIFGNVFDSTVHAQLAEAGTAWDGGTWNGATWSGATWSGVTRSGSTWSGSTWSGSTWSGSSWSGATWSGATWSGATWSGSTWSGSTWSGATWSGTTWSSTDAA
jgi:serine protease AprX